MMKSAGQWSLYETYALLRTCIECGFRTMKEAYKHENRRLIWPKLVELRVHRDFNQLKSKMQKCLGVEIPPCITRWEHYDPRFEDDARMGGYLLPDDEEEAATLAAASALLELSPTRQPKMRRWDEQNKKMFCGTIVTVPPPVLPPFPTPFYL